jgi:hypothetical protein
MIFMAESSQGIGIQGRPVRHSRYLAAMHDHLRRVGRSRCQRGDGTNRSRCLEMQIGGSGAPAPGLAVTIRHILTSLGG